MPKSKNFTIRKLSYSTWYEIVVFEITEKNQSKTKKSPENTEEDRIYI